MIVAKSQISQAVNAEVAKFQEWASKHQDQLQAASENEMTGCVFVQQVSARKYHIGWRFAANGTETGTIQTDPHISYNRNQRIVWVA